jgi:hypothetical protein
MNQPLEERICGLIKVLSQTLPVGIEGTHAINEGAAKFEQGSTHPLTSLTALLLH